MEDSRFKRNVLALLVAIPVIYFLSIATTLFGDKSVKIWGWDVFFDSPITDLHSDSSFLMVANLNGQWRFAPGDDAARAQVDFDDSSWTEIHVPDYWEGEGFKNYDGFGWYRREFQVDEDKLNRLLYADLGKIDDTDEVFINGVRIGGTGEFPPAYVGAYSQDRRYTIPEGLLQEGENLIAVRVYDAQMGGGIYEGNIGIYATRYPAPLVNLEGEWQFWLEGEEEDKRAIQVPGFWEHQGVRNYDGIAWYSKQFTALEVPTDETLVLLLGRIDDTDEVTINGEFIGRTGNLDSGDRKVDPDYHRIERRYEFSASLLKDNNILEVRVHDSGGEGGIYDGPVAIVTRAAYNKYLQETAGK